jgi:hypothetical protein
MLLCLLPSFSFATIIAKTQKHRRNGYQRMLRQSIVLLAALFVGLIGFVAVESFSSSFQNCVGQNSSQAATQQSDNQKRSAVSAIRAYARCTERFADKHNALITALATILLSIITLGLILSGIDQQRTTQAQLRAYISVEPGMSFRQSRKKNARFEFRPNVVNSGQTPASNVRILSRTDFKSREIPATFDYALQSTTPGSNAAIAPSKEKFHSAIMPRQLTWGELREHAKGMKWFHVWGQVVYEDIFKIERHTYFSFLIFVPTRKRENPVWLATERHNYYD